MGRQTDDALGIADHRKASGALGVRLGIEIDCGNACEGGVSELRRIAAGIRQNPPGRPEVDQIFERGFRETRVNGLQLPSRLAGKGGDAGEFFAPGGLDARAEDENGVHAESLSYFVCERIPMVRAR